MLKSQVRRETSTMAVVISAHAASRSAARVGAREVAAAATMRPVEGKRSIGTELGIQHHFHRAYPSGDPNGIWNLSRRQ
jgi:hypothetical protein